MEAMAGAESEDVAQGRRGDETPRLLFLCVFAASRATYFFNNTRFLRL
jgi:hypothetical protein